MPDPYGYLRSCTACSAHLLSYATRDRQEGLLCSACLPGEETAEEILAQNRPRLTLWTHPNTREFVLLYRDGDRIVVRQLGFPDAESFETTVAQVRPRFSYTKLARVKRDRAKAAQAKKAARKRA